MMRACLAFALLLAPAMPAVAQAVRLNGSPLRPMGIVVGGASISATPGTVDFALVSGGSANGSSSITVSTQIAAIGVLSTVQIVAYFASSTALSTASGDSIPASAVYARCSTCSSTAWGNFTQASSLGGNNSFVLQNGTSLLTITGGTRTDNLSLKIDLSGSPQQPAGSYTGTLVIAAQVF